MGMYSYNCKHCGKSIRSSQGHHMDWMKYAVLVFRNGSVLKDTSRYEGYGFGDEAEGSFAAFHYDCYEAAGSPAFDSPSDGARDQGWGDLEPFTYFPPGYDPESYLPPNKRAEGGSPEFNSEPREVHAEEALSVLKEMAPFLDELGLNAQMTLNQALAHLEEMVAKDRAAFEAKIEESRQERERQKMKVAADRVREAGLDPDNLIESLPDQPTVYPKDQAHGIRDMAAFWAVQDQLTIQFLGAPDYDAVVKKVKKP